MWPEGWFWSVGVAWSDHAGTYANAFLLPEDLIPTHREGDRAPYLVINGLERNLKQL